MRSARAVVAWMLAATAKFLQTNPADLWKPFYDPATFSVSTFSADVDTASYAVIRSSLNAGQLPPAEAVRVD